MLRHTESLNREIFLPVVQVCSKVRFSFFFFLIGSIFFFQILFIYFIYGCVGSSFLCEGFL